MRIKKLAGLIIIFTLCMISVFGYVWEGFERENLWVISALDRNVIDSMKIDKNVATAVNLSGSKTTEGNNSLRIDLNKTTWGWKGFVSREGLFDFSRIDEIKFDIYSEKAIVLSVGFSTGPTHTWYESGLFYLKPGWNRNITLNLKSTEWKSRVSQWENFIKIQNLNEIKKISLVFAKGAKQTVYIDNMRFSGNKVKNDAYSVPHEPIEKLKVASGYDMLKGLKIAPFTPDNSGKVTRSNGLYTLPYKDITEFSKAGYIIEPKRNWRKVSKVRLKIKNNNVDYCALSLGFQVGQGYIWYETQQYLLKPQDSTEIIINLNAPYFKSEASDWMHNTFLYNKFDIFVINFMISGVFGKISTGDLTLESFDFLEGKEYVVNRKVLSPQYYENLNKSKYSNPKVTKLHKFDSKVKKYDKFELTFNLKNKYINPFNPDEIYCEGIFYGPRKKKYRVPGFYYEEPSKNKKAKKKKQPQTWKIRFAPPLEGDWRFEIRVRNLAGNTIYKTSKTNFKCTPSEHKGFIGKGGHLFTYQDGSVFYPYGLTLGWVTSYDKNNYFDYLEKFYKSGMNWTRMWNIPWGLKLEWNKPKRGGLGKYSQEDANEWDKIIEYARERNIHINYCINNYRDLTKGYNWENNPYCYLEGGPLKEPEFFFSNRIAKKYFKRKLLYIVARWGYSTSIFAWELFNEVDLSTNYDEERVAKWHKEMAAYVKSIDPYKHLVTSSFSRRLHGDMTFSIPEIDMSQTHVYTEDLGQALFSIPELKVKKYNKPHITGEIGGSVEIGAVEAKDKTGIRIHNVIWYSFFSNAPSSALYWWWDEYVEKNNLYFHYKSFTELTKNVDFNDRQKVPVRIITKGTGDYSYAPVIDWEKPTGRVYEMINNELVGEGSLAQYMQGITHGEWRVDPEFKIKFLRKAKFLMNVDNSSYRGSAFTVYLDGKKHFSKKFPAIGSRTSHVVNDVFEIDMPKGTHTIKISNDGVDWFKIKWFKFTNSVPDVESYGLRCGDKVFIWVKNRQFNIDNVMDKKRIKPAKSGELEIENYLNWKKYNISYYDTWSHKSLKIISEKLNKGRVRIKYPKVKKDILIVVEKGL